MSLTTAKIKTKDWDDWGTLAEQAKSGNQDAWTRLVSSALSVLPNWLVNKTGGPDALRLA